MKKLSILLLLILPMAFHLSAQSGKELKADIKHVTVFPDRAQIDHETSVTLQPGKTTLKLSGLSPYIDAQSVQVKGYGDFMVMSVNHQNNYLQNLVESQEDKNIPAQITALLLKIEDEKAAISVLKEKASFLIANKALLIKETAVTAEHIRSVIDLYSNNMEQITMTTLKKERLIKEYEKQMTALQQQISTRPGIQQIPSGEISISVANDNPVTGRLVISYVVSNTGWYPSYDIRVDDIKNPVSISYKANVFQNSGTPWKDVKISLSNATPWVSGNIPVLYPWYLDFFNPPQIMISRNKSSASMNEAPVMVSESVRARDVMELESAPPDVQKQVGATTITFDIAIPYTIPSDGRIQTIEIQRLKAPADYKYVTLPKLSTQAYLTANINDWAKLSLQSGEATLYFENSFVGKSNINVNQLGDTMTISLGTDNSILVKREKRKDLTTRRVIGANKTETFSFLLSIRNNKSVPVRITLKDQIPVSSNSGITVETIELSGGKHDSLTGEINWDLEVKPEETKQFILTYSVKYPKDRRVILEQ